MPEPVSAPRPKKPKYEPPRILWEETFIALAQATPPPCIPGQDPRCTP